MSEGERSEPERSRPRRGSERGEIDTREEEITSIKQSLMIQMGEAETLTFEGKVLATWKAPKPSFRLDSKRLELEHPEIASNYKTQVQNSRRLVVKQIND